LPQIKSIWDAVEAGNLQDAQNQQAAVKAAAKKLLAEADIVWDQVGDEIDEYRRLVAEMEEDSQ
jgi:hypothetical protein